jgi:hypothetical protein
MRSRQQVAVTLEQRSASGSEEGAGYCGVGGGGGAWSLNSLEDSCGEGSGGQRPTPKRGQQVSRASSVSRVPGDPRGELREARVQQRGQAQSVIHSGMSSAEGSNAGWDTAGYMAELFCLLEARRRVCRSMVKGEADARGSR